MGLDENSKFFEEINTYLKNKTFIKNGVVEYPNQIYERENQNTYLKNSILSAAKEISKRLTHQCPGKHELKKFQTPKSSFYCDVCCERDIEMVFVPIGTSMRGC